MLTNSAKKSRGLNVPCFYMFLGVGFLFGFIATIITPPVGLRIRRELRHFGEDVGLQV